VYCLLVVTIPSSSCSPCSLPMLSSPSSSHKTTHTLALPLTHTQKDRSAFTGVDVDFFSLRSDGFQNEFERLSERLCLLPSKDIQKKKTETPEKSKYKLADSKTKCNKTKQKNKGKHFFVVHLRKNRLLNARCNRNNNKSSTTKSLKKATLHIFSSAVQTVRKT